MQGGRAVSSRPEHLCAGTIIDAPDVTMPDEHDHSTEAAQALRSTVWRPAVRAAAGRLNRNRR